jgi:hypothetical protein
MDIFVKNTLSGLIPLYPSDMEEKKKLKLGQEYKSVITNPRNYEFHKKFFALLNLGHQNTRMEMSFDFYRDYVIMKAGYVQIAITPEGEMYKPKSISFASMEQSVFEDLYSRAINVIIKDIGATSEEIERELINFF